MIFVTVGSQLPFDRLIKTVDEWAASNQGRSIFAQIGNSTYKPKHIQFCQTMTPDSYRQYLDQAQLIIAHAGMGTIISALDGGKNLILMPRLASYGEHRNDHQLATINRFAHFSNISVAKNESELAQLLTKLPNNLPTQTNKIATAVSPALIKVISDFVNAI